MTLRTFVVILISFPSIAHGQSEQVFEPLNDSKQLKMGIAEMAQSTTSIKTSFKQKKSLSILSNVILSEGKMIFKKPNALKWSYTNPYNYAIIFKGNEIIIDDEGKISEFDISSSKVFLEINQILVNSISGNILQEEQFVIQYFENKSYYLAKMKPKVDRLKTYIDMIEVFIDRNDFTVSSIKLIEKGNDYTLIDFFDKKLNEYISDKTFEVN